MVKRIKENESERGKKGIARGKKRIAEKRKGE
jgi:hypothetical protein